MDVVTPDRALLAPVVSATFEYWRSKVRDQTMPARHQLDPCEIPGLLPWIMLTDVFHDPLDFRYRLIGTQIVAQSRHDYTGRRFSEMDHTGPATAVWSDRLKVVETRQPVLSTPPYSGPKAGTAAVSGIHLPLSNDGRTVDMILTAVDFTMILKTLG